MNRSVLCLLFLCCSILSSGLYHTCQTRAAESQKRERRAESLARVPAAAVEVYEYVLRTGRAPEGYVGGRVWENREHRLPRSGNYREYDIHPKVRGKNRGAERIIIDSSTKNGWYTGDHYRTFTHIERRGNDK